MLLRQVQAGPLQGHRLRALRRRGHPLEGPPRAHGPHRPRRAGLPHLVLQGRPEPDRLPDRHGSEGAREGPLLRRLAGHLDRRGGPREGPAEAREGGQQGPRRVPQGARAAHPGARRVDRAPHRLHRVGRRRPGQVLRRGPPLGGGPGLDQEALGGRQGEARQGDAQGPRRRDRRHRGLPRRRDRAHGGGLEDLLRDEGQGRHQRRGRLPRAEGPLRVARSAGASTSAAAWAPSRCATCSSRSTSRPRRRSSRRRSTPPRARSRPAR